MLLANINIICARVVLRLNHDNVGCEWVERLGERFAEAIRWSDWVRCSD